MLLRRIGRRADDNMRVMVLCGLGYARVCIEEEYEGIGEDGEIGRMYFLQAPMAATFFFFLGMRRQAMW